MISYLLIYCIEQFEFEKEGERVMAGNNTYDAGSIAVLEGLEAVRKRPGMYIGSVSTKGLNHLIYEIVDNSVDEHLAGACSQIRVTLEADGSIHDPYRVDYMSRHIAAMKEAVEEGVDLMGYTMWSCIDLVSASSGELRKRYGFVYVDAHDDGTGTFKRYRKDSFWWYKKVIESNGEDLG